MEENFKLNTDLNIEPEFWGDFVQEAYEHLDDIESNVLSLEQDPENMDIIHTMFRAYHTIKGLSGFVEHTIIQEVAHKTETMMDLCRKQELKVNKDIVDAILKSSDFIKRLCEEIDSYKDADFISNIESHLVVLEAISNGGGVDVDPSSPVDVVQVSESTVQDIEVNVETAQDSNEQFNGEFISEGSESSAEPEFVVNNFPLDDEGAFSGDNQITEVVPLSSDVSVQMPDQKFSDVSPLEVKKVEIVEPKQVVQAKKTEPVSKPSVSETPKRAVTEEYMKVANSKIDHLVDMIGELIINQSLIEQHITFNYANDSKLVSEMSGFLAITRELQYLSMSLRMVSLRSTFQKITRIARDTIQELHKDVEFVTSGENTEIDRVVTDKLLDPLVHLIKNAISHGCEEHKEDRIAAGKSPKARVELNAYNKRGKIYIEVKDDGRGINTEVVYKKALEKGLIDPNAAYTDAEIKEFVFLPGFSTAAVVDNISGRGVGMDVVRTQILKIGGKVEITSELGVGSTFTLEVPVNHAIMNGTVIEMMGNNFIVPTMNVKEILQPADNQWIATQQKNTMLRVRDDIIPIVPLSLLFKDYVQANSAKLVILLESDQELRALPIDNVINRQEVVVKPVGPEFADLKYISGMSILGDGRVSLILDIDYLFKKEVKE